MITDTTITAETLSVSIPGTLKRYVEDRAAEEGYGNPGEYVVERPGAAVATPRS